MYFNPAGEIAHSFYRGYTGSFLLGMATQFQEIMALPSHLQISVCSLSCAGNVTSSEKLQKTENSEYSGNFYLSANFAITLGSRTAVFRSMATQQFLKIALQ